MLQDNTHNFDSQLFNFASNQAFTLSELVDAGKKYPYSLPIQVTLARALKQSKPIDYEKFVKTSAVLSPDRQWLYDFLQSPTDLVKKQQIPEPVKDQFLTPDQETKIFAVETKPLIVTPEPEALPLIETLPTIDLGDPVVIDLEEVTLPEPSLPLADDSNEIIEKALKQVGTEKPEIKTPVVQPEPAEPLFTAKNDILEREILKEAIDKSIQKEVGEIQPDFASPEKQEEQENQQGNGFQYWLNPARKKAESREQKLKKIDALIEKFIKSEPRIVAKKSEFFSPANAAKQSVAVNEDLVSEPLALIFEKQGYFDKAIKAYEKLSLKFPEKRAYFATRIEKIKEIVRNIKNNKE